MYNLEELYIANNNLKNIINMPNLQILNCIGNPITKIKYFPNLQTLMTSIPLVSSQYNIANISKYKSDYIISFHV